LVKKQLIQMGRLVLGVGLLFALIYYFSNPGELYALFVGSDKLMLVAAAVFFLGHYFAIFWRWRFLLRQVGQFRFTGKEILRSLFAGSALGLFTPGRIGELGRGVFFPPSYFWSVSGLTLAEKLYAHMVTIVLGILAFLYFGFAALQLPALPFIALLLILLGLSITFLWRPTVLRRFYYFLHRRLGVRLGLNLWPAVRALRLLDRPRGAVLFGLSLLINLLAFGEFFLLLTAFEKTALLPAFVAFEAAYFAVTFVPVSMANIGIREGFRIFFYGLIGATAAAVLNASLLMFALNMLLPAAIGMTILPDYRQQLSKGVWKF
jgi:uncharacterized membrane protein YbhN (UPF0104 family)